MSEIVKWIHIGYSQVIVIKDTSNASSDVLCISHDIASFYYNAYKTLVFPHFTFCESVISHNHFRIWLLPSTTRVIVFLLRLPVYDYPYQLSARWFYTNLAWRFLLLKRSNSTDRWFYSATAIAIPVATVLAESRLIYSIPSIKSNIWIIINFLFYLTGFGANAKRLHRKSIIDCSQPRIQLSTHTHTSNWVKFMSECVWLVECIKCAKKYYSL